MKLKKSEKVTIEKDFKKQEVLDNEMLKQFGKRISDYRKRVRITQEELSEKLGVSKNFLGTVERGKGKLSLEKTVLLSVVTGLSLDYLIFGKNVEQEKIEQSLAIIEEAESYYTAGLDEKIDNKGINYKSIETIISRRAHHIYKILDDYTNDQLTIIAQFIVDFKDTFLQSGLK